MEIRYRQPTPTDTPLTAVGNIVKVGAARAVVHGEIRLPDGIVTAEAIRLLRRPNVKTAILAGGDVGNRTYQNNYASLAVLKSTYDVVVVENAKQKVIDAVDCTGDTCSVDAIIP